MPNAKLTGFVEAQIKHNEEKMQNSKSAKLDDMAYARLGFYLALRRALAGTSSAQDLGLLDAVNDVLQALDLLDSEETFVARLKAES